MLHALAVSALLATAVDAPAAPPPLRLPGDVRPLRQAIDLSIDPGREAYSGVVDVELEVTRDTPLLWLNATGLKVTSASLGPEGRLRPARVVAGGDDFVGFAPEAPLAAGRARLRASFEGTVSRLLNEGLFAMKEGDEWYAFTQFEPISARRAFPCFDEPSYKIPWDVTLRVPSGQVALSNAPAVSKARDGDRDVVRFAPTRPLPAYLVAMAVGPFEVVDLGPAGRNATPSRLAVPKGRGGDTAWARESTLPILALLEDYFDRPYPYEKLDQVAIPGVGFAMEHPGLVTYGMGLMVQRPGEESIASRGLGERVRSRARTHVVRRPGDDGLVGRHLAERVVRELDGREDDRAVPDRLGDRDGARRGAVGRARGRQPGHGAAHPAADRVEGRHQQRLRRDHLREGRGRSRDGRGLARREGLPPGRAALPRAPCLGQRHGFRLPLRPLGRRRARRGGGALPVPRPDRGARRLGRDPLRRGATARPRSAAVPFPRLERRAEGLAGPGVRDGRRGAALPAPCSRKPPARSGSTRARTGPTPTRARPATTAPSSTPGRPAARWRPET
jgi:hypothetical protein